MTWRSRREDLLMLFLASESGSRDAKQAVANVPDGGELILPWAPRSCGNQTLTSGLDCATMSNIGNAIAEATLPAL